MVSLVFDQTPEAPTGDVAVHRLAPPQVNRPAIISMLSHLDLTDRLPTLEWDRRGSWLTTGDERVRVAMNVRSGGFRYRLRPLQEEQGDLGIADDRLEEIARGFLDGLGRPNEPVQLERITNLQAQDSSTDGERSDVVTLDAGLVFRRTVDDLPVVGTGGFVMVRIGSDEAVIGGRQVWRSTTVREPAAKVRSVGQAIELLRQRLDAQGLEGEATVRKAVFGYEELGIETVQRRLQPVYAFLVEQANGGIGYKTAVVIPAMEPVVA